MQKQRINEIVLFYAWTDTQIVNAVYMKLSVYRETTAELLIYGLSRVSEELILKIKKENIFSFVYVLEKPIFCMERKRKGIKEKLSAVFLGKAYRQYFEKNLNSLIGKKKYTVFLTGAFWSESLLVFQYLKKINSNIEISFFEEGLADYNGPSKWLYRTAPQIGLKASVRSLLYYGFAPLTLRKYVRDVYLYRPQLSNITYLKLKKIPDIASDKNKIFLEICRNDKESFDEFYKNAAIVIIGDALNSEKKSSVEVMCKILDILYGTMSNVNIIMKLHPIMCSLYKEQISARYPGLIIDDRKKRIEDILIEENIDQKLLIAGNSSSIHYIRFVQGKKPYIVFIDFEKKKRLSEYKIRFAQGDHKIRIAKNMKELENIAVEMKSCIYIPGGGS